MRGASHIKKMKSHEENSTSISILSYCHGCGAQTEVASAVGEFDFITKNFTVGQKTIPYSLVKDFLTALREP